MEGEDLSALLYDGNDWTGDDEDDAPGEPAALRAIYRAGAKQEVAVRTDTQLLEAQSHIHKPLFGAFHTRQTLRSYTLAIREARGEAGKRWLVGRGKSHLLR